jgi:Protein of unknown function (DUF2889)
VRRASHIAVRWPDGDLAQPIAELHVHGAVRDIASGVDGVGRVGGDATLDCVLAPDRTVTAIVAEPSAPGLETLVGRVARSGWRAAARAVVGSDSPLATLLDDVPIAVMLSSYGALRQGQLDTMAVRPLMLHMRDRCAGWAADATPMRTLDAGSVMPLPGVVPAPVEHGRDPLAAEPAAPMVPGEVRRSRRLDVTPGEQVQVDASFRDSWCDPEGGEGILHEYVLTAVLDRDGVIESIAAEPRVLPYEECMLAAASPQRRLVGRRIGEVPEIVAASAGSDTCTHLDDLLRSLAAVPGLLRVATREISATAGDAADPDW